jgi:hypothetical protein
MAFDDALIGSDDFDPRTAQDDLIRQQAAPSSLPVVLDPHTLATRLARKLNEPSPAAAPVDMAPDAAISSKPDFSGEAVEPQTPNANLDFSAQAEDANVPQPQAKPPSLGIVAQGKAALKGIPHGAIEHTGGVLQGGAAIYQGGVPAAPAMRRLRCAGQSRSAHRPSRRRRSRPLPLKERPLYKAGKAVKDFAQEVAPMSDAGEGFDRRPRRHGSSVRSRLTPCHRDQPAGWHGRRCRRHGDATPMARSTRRPRSTARPTTCADVRCRSIRPCCRRARLAAARRRQICPNR